MKIQLYIDTMVKQEVVEIVSSLRLYPIPYDQFQSMLKHDANSDQTSRDKRYNFSLIGAILTTRMA